MLGEVLCQCNMWGGLGVMYIGGKGWGKGVRYICLLEGVNNVV